MKKTALFLILVLFSFQGISQQWLTIVPAGQFGGNDLFFIDADYGYGFGAYGGKIKRTSDGGLTYTVWNPDSVLGMTFNSTSLHFPVRDTGYAYASVVGSSVPSVLLKTVDEGMTWNLLPLPSQAEGQGVFFVTPMTGFIGGDKGILKTTDGGANWTYQNLFSQGAVLSFHFIDDSTGYAGSNAGHVFKTTDCGQSWTMIMLNTMTQVWNIDFVDASYGYLSTGTGSQVAYKTTDAGNTWNPIPAFYGQQRINFINRDTGFLTTSSGVYYTTNGGAAWSITNITTWCRALCSPDPTTVYTSNGGFRKWSWLTTSVPGVNESHASFIVYPDPLKDVLNISTLAGNSFNSISICNIAGNIELSQEYKENSSIDVSDLSPGVYLIRLSSSTSSSVKRFVKVR